MALFLAPLVVLCSLEQPVVFPFGVVDATLRFPRSLAFGLAVMGTGLALNTTDTMHMFMFSSSGLCVWDVEGHFVNLIELPRPCYLKRIRVSLENLAVFLEWYLVKKTTMIFKIVRAEGQSINGLETKNTIVL